MKLDKRYDAQMKLQSYTKTLDIPCAVDITDHAKLLHGLENRELRVCSILCLPSNLL